ncbi:hypothetical protein GOD78_30275 [Sinorhizobium medicae]|uniref:hypothetical protein n=1 Tax=Sinorhizobium medicae TaxID=110321 RepID=UPI000FDBA414|nr:hypothetical protein [Sinorhizobium medicae]MDX0605414.1 hypothetical protein [Sinorhizobium medicae]MDX0760322.1 hypothetical protein [Sinorhizobium medicae]MDX0766435.1 hypothetical protein [Sinorhizobium medicae]MDX0797029.1 hypothetical protein [Sinorhizobium medicae]MDX0821655.1 hypothetical protein [Sinorhizobium medicae]
MIYQRPAYEEVTIAHGGNTVTLRPSLWAAATLEARHGFPALFRALDDFNLTIISEIILLSASVDRQDTAAFLLCVRERPLFPFFLAVRQPLAELLSMLTPAPDPKAKPATGKPVSLRDFYQGLYAQATGWLGWTPEVAWNATPTEIDRAYAAHVAKLKAIHGSADDQPGEQADDYTPERLKEIDELGYDPAFDRNGLNALRSKIARQA